MHFFSVKCAVNLALRTATVKNEILRAASRSSLSLNFHTKVLVFQHRRKLFCQQEIKWAYMDTLCQNNIFCPKNLTFLNIWIFAPKLIKINIWWFDSFIFGAKIQIFQKAKIFLNWIFGQKSKFWNSVDEEPAWVFEQEFLWLCIPLAAFTTKIFLEDSFQGRKFFFLCALNPASFQVKIREKNAKFPQKIG